MSPLLLHILVSPYILYLTYCPWSSDSGDPRSDKQHACITVLLNTVERLASVLFLLANYSAASYFCLVLFYLCCVGLKCAGLSSAK